MPKLVVRGFTLFLDGYSAAPGQALDAPFGKNGLRLMNWAFPPKYFKKMTGQSGGDDGVDNDVISRADDNVGATIMGRNMFGPLRGAWSNDEWKGWWGEEPPYHHPVFVLSHHNRAAFDMKGGTRFAFVTDGY